MASNTPSSLRAENGTMGNTQVTIAGHDVHFSQRDQIPTVVPVAQAHNVQVASTSSTAVFSANLDQKTNTATDLLSPSEHKSTGDSHASFSAVHGPRTPPTVSQPNSRWAEEEEDEPMVNEDDEQARPEKVPTPPHSFSPTRLSFPPHPPHDEIPDTDPNGTVLIFSIDLKSQGTKFAMQITRAHNEGMLLKIISKFSASANEPFSPSTILPGLKKQQIDVFAISNEKQKELKQQLKYKAAAAAASAAPSSAPAPPSSVAAHPPSHKFILKFNSTSSRDLSLSYLQKIGINAYVPRPRIIKGLVYGCWEGNTAQFTSTCR